MSMSDDEVFGSASQSQGLDDAAVFGAAPPEWHAAAEAWDSVKTVFKDAANAVVSPKEEAGMPARVGGNPINQIKKLPGRIVGSAMQAEDMITQLYAGLARTAGFPTSAALHEAINVATTGDSNSSEAAKAAKEDVHAMIPQSVQAPFSKLAEIAGPDAEKMYNDNPVAWIFNKVTEASTKGTAELAKKSGVPQEWYDQAVEGVMSVLGVKGIKGSVKGSMDARAKAAEQAKMDKTVQAAPVDEAAPAETPTTTEGGASLTPTEVGEQPFRSTMPEPPTAKELAATRKARGAELRSAFKSDPETADWLNFKAGENMEARAKALVDQAEKEGRGPASEEWPDLVRRVQEINDKPPMERTADDLVTLRHYNRGLFVDQFQKGGIDSKLLPHILGTLAVGGAASLMALQNYLGGPDSSEEGNKAMAGLGAVLMAGMVKGPEGIKVDRTVETALLDKVRAGDQKAATELYTKNIGPLTRQMTKFTRDPVQGEELAHDAMALAMRHLDSFRGDAAFSTWVYRIGQNVAKNSLVAKARRPQTTELTPEMSEQFGSTAEEPSAQMEAQEMHARVNAAMDKLPDEFRSAVEMRELEGLEYAEIADRLGIPINTVRSRLSRGRALLTEALKRNAGRKIAVGAATGYLAAQDQKEAALGLGLLGMTEGVHSALGPALERVGVTTKTLERLPKNKTEFSKSEIEQQLKRDDVAGAEKEILGQVLKEHQGGKISAGELVRGFEEKTRDFRLEAKETGQYADYGLENIGKHPSHQDYGWEHEAATGEIPPAKTTLYRLPAHMEVSDANHFSDPRLFGWTRSFKEDGVRHVVELQSDLAQKLGMKASERDLAEYELHKALSTKLGAATPKDFIELWKSDKRLAEVMGESLAESAQNVRGLYEKLEEKGMWPLREKGEERLLTEGLPLLEKESPGIIQKALNSAKGFVDFVVTETGSKVNAPKTAQQLSPILKNWPRRLIQEELAQAAKGGETAVRFATGDTVAKVEGWPVRNDNGIKNEFVHPEHESIYRRYSGEISRYLKSLGGKEVTDAQGHSWIEVPVQPGHYAKMWGAADPHLLAKVAVVGGAAALNAYMNPESPIWSGVKGALGGVLAASVRPFEVAKFITRASNLKPMIKIDDLTQATVYARGVAKRAAYQMATRIEKAVPTQARREAIYDYLDGLKVTLSPEELRMAQQVRDFFDSLGNAAKQGGVIREMLENYATRIYGKEGKSLLSPKMVGGNTSLDSPFGKRRAFMTREEAAAAGHVPLTTDIAKVVEAYSDSISTALENRNFIKTLRGAEVDGVPLIAKEGKAPSDYTFIDHPQLRGLRVHPDIAADLRFIFDQTEVGPVIKSLDAINTFQKRMAVSMSLFHAAALEHAMLGATPLLKSPIRGIKIAAQSFAPRIFGENLAVRMIKEGGAGDAYDHAMKDRLKVSFERESAGLEELHSNFYQALDKTSKFLDQTIPGLGKQTVGRFQQLNHIFDKAMWGRFHAAMKMETYMDKVAELSRNNAKEVSAGRQELKSRDDIGRMAASFTNDVFGGLDWQGISQEFTSRWGRELASAMVSPKGRLGLRMVLFAPDWTISTTRAFLKAFGQRGTAAAAGAALGSNIDPDHPLAGGFFGALAGYGAGRAMNLKQAGGTSVRGLYRPTELADLHRQYLMRSALIYTTIVDTLNYKFTGHHIWSPEQKDKTRLDLGDGRTMQVSKHFMEPFHWLLTPRQQAMNKLSFVMKEPLSQLQDVEYLSATGAPRMGGRAADEAVTLGDRAKHVAKSFNPIAVQQSWDASGTSGLSGFLGAPIYGHTTEEKQRMKAERKEKARQRRAQKRLKEAQR